MKKSKSHISADAFFESLLENPEVRIRYQEERSKTEIAATIRAARKRAGLTQEQLAKKIGSTQSVIARLESGNDARSPTLPLLARIAGACNEELEIRFSFKKAAGF